MNRLQTKISFVFSLAKSARTFTCAGSIAAGMILSGCAAKNTSFGNAIAIPGSAYSQGSQLSILSFSKLSQTTGLGVLIPTGECMGFFVSIQGTHNAFNASLGQSGHVQFFSDSACQSPTSQLSFPSSESSLSFYLNDSVAETVTISASASKYGSASFMAEFTLASPSPGVSPSPTHSASPSPTPTASPSASPTSSPSSGGFSIGQLVQIVNVTAGDQADIWSGPGVSGYTLVGNENESAQGTVIGGPSTDSSGNIWYDVTFTNGTSGWDTSAYLGAVSGGSTPSPSPSPTPTPSPSASPSPVPIPSGSPLWTGILTPARATDWSAAGVPGGIPNRTTICATLNASSYGNGTTDATSAIQTALNNCPVGQVVLLGAGTFLINDHLNVTANVSLRGAGANQTILNAKGNFGNGVVNLGVPDGNWSWQPQGGAISVTGGSTQGSTSITLANMTGVTVGSYLLVNELNDSSFVNSTGSEGACTWCDLWNGTRSANQIVQVTSVAGSTVGFTPPLFINYQLTPLATPIPMYQGAGVENLQVYANNTGYGFNFFMGNCTGCWISGVEGNYADGDHVGAYLTYHSSVVNSYFSNAFLHGAGSYDSDVDLAIGSTGDLVQNNILERLHVDIMLEWGAAGNVVAYNYMFGQFDSGAPYAMFPAFDLHGAHPMYNLWEGNVGSDFESDSTWGSSSDNTAFRNWAMGTVLICETTGRQAANCASNGSWSFQSAQAMQYHYESTSNNEVGNVVGSTQQMTLAGNYNGNGINGTNGTPEPHVNMAVAVCGSGAPTTCGPGSLSYDEATYNYAIGYGEGSDDGSSGFDSIQPFLTLFLHGDYTLTNNATTWANGVTQSLPASFYLKSKPAWFGSTPWPAMGPDVTGGTDVNGHVYAIPAENCYKKVMGGTDGTGSPLAGFNAATCYGVTP